MLGLPEGTRWLDVASPFSPEQLQVRYVSNLSTRHQHRADSLLPICQLIAEQYRQRPGNYLAFFSSYRYLEQVVELLQSHWPGIPLQVQSAGMDEAARRAFLDSFTGDSRQVGFAVLGGAFGEGIDLPGERLIGAFIATLGLPQVNPVTEQIRARMDQLFGHGHDYAYLFPGLQKVVQAAGRVIRSPEDQGVLWRITASVNRGCASCCRGGGRWNGTIWRRRCCPAGWPICSANRLLPNQAVADALAAGR